MVHVFYDCQTVADATVGNVIDSSRHYIDISIWILYLARVIRFRQCEYRWSVHFQSHVEHYLKVPAGVAT